MRFVVGEYVFQVREKCVELRKIGKSGVCARFPTTYLSGDKKVVYCSPGFPSERYIKPQY